MTLILIVQEKRSIFPRFYFIGDDDLLEILGQATNPVVIQSHLKKLFAGIHSVEFDEEQGHILAMRSLEGEVVELKKPVPISNDVEVYMCMCVIYERVCVRVSLCVCVYICVIYYE